MNKLKPCPFCGGEVRLRFVNDDMEYCCFDDAEDKSQEEGFHIHCYNCDSDFYHDEPIDIINKTIEWWNTRKPIDDIMEQLESPLEQLKAYVQEYCNECDCEPKCSGMQALDEIRKIVKAGGTDE